VTLFSRLRRSESHALFQKKRLEVVALCKLDRPSVSLDSTLFKKSNEQKELGLVWSLKVKKENKAVPTKHVIFFT